MVFIDEVTYHQTTTSTFGMNSQLIPFLKNPMSCSHFLAVCREIDQQWGKWEFGNSSKFTHIANVAAIITGSPFQ